MSSRAMGSQSSQTAESQVKTAPSFPAFPPSCRLPRELMIDIIAYYMDSRWSDIIDRRETEVKLRRATSTELAMVKDPDERTAIFTRRKTDFTVLGLLGSCSYIQYLVLPKLYNRIAIYRPRQAESFLRKPHPSSYRHITHLVAEYCYVGQSHIRWGKRNQEAVNALDKRLRAHYEQKGGSSFGHVREFRGCFTTGAVSPMMPMGLVDVLRMQTMSLPVDGISPMSKRTLESLDGLMAKRQSLVDDAREEVFDLRSLARSSMEQPTETYYKRSADLSRLKRLIKPAPLRITTLLFHPHIESSHPPSQADYKARFDNDLSHVRSLKYLARPTSPPDTRPKRDWQYTFRVYLRPDQLGPGRSQRSLFDSWTGPANGTSGPSKLEYLHRILERDSTNKITFLPPEEEIEMTAGLAEAEKTEMQRASHIFCGQSWPTWRLVASGRIPGTPGLCYCLSEKGHPLRVKATDEGEIASLRRCMWFTKGFGFMTGDAFSERIRDERAKIEANRPLNIWQSWLHQFEGLGE